MLRTLRNNKAVTLVELLAVIVILAIIAAIAVPTIGNMIDRQRANAAAASGNSLLEVFRIYATENPEIADTDYTAANIPADVSSQLTTVPVIADITINVDLGVVTVTLGTTPTIDGYAVLLDGGVFVRDPA